MKQPAFEATLPVETLRVWLQELEPCFQGIIPATLATCSPEGIPNLTPLSIVHRVDDEHIAPPAAAIALSKLVAKATNF